MSRTAERQAVPSVAKGSGINGYTDDAFVVLGGDIDLPVVGESHHEAAVLVAAGERSPRRLHQVDLSVTAVLVPQPENPYDANAIAVFVAGNHVGYLSRYVAQRYQPHLLALERRHGKRIGLSGRITGAVSSEGHGVLTVTLKHDPADFGFAPSRIRTEWTRPDDGLSGLLSSTESGTNLGWVSEVPDDGPAAIAFLRGVLIDERLPMNRHFIFNRLESELYRSREAFESALAEFDVCCKEHDAEMTQIRSALMSMWGVVPYLPTYKQMAIRQQKAQNFANALWWAERGVSIYGSDAGREDSVTDLEKRIGIYRKKLRSP